MWKENDSRHQWPIKPKKIQLATKLFINLQKNYYFAAPHHLPSPLHSLCSSSIYPTQSKRTDLNSSWHKGRVSVKPITLQNSLFLFQYYIGTSGTELLPEETILSIVQVHSCRYVNTCFKPCISKSHAICIHTTIHISVAYARVSNTENKITHLLSNTLSRRLTVSCNGRSLWNKYLETRTDRSNASPQIFISQTVSSRVCWTVEQRINKIWKYLQTRIFPANFIFQKILVQDVHYGHANV